VQPDDDRQLQRRQVRGRPLYLKQGVRGFPGLAPGAELLIEHVELGTSERAIDASGSAGAVALGLRPQPAGWTVLEPSAAALRCARATFAGAPAVRVEAGLVWDAAGAGADTVCLLPSSDRGGARVEAELTGACLALRPGGRAYLALHRDRGARRYERLAAELFGRAEVVARSSGWRLTRAERTRTPPAVEWLGFEAAGLALLSLPGVFAAGKLDPGTAALLAAVDLATFAGLRVLDLGCGYGPLALLAACAGAAVTALDDDLAAVRSTERNAVDLGLELEVRHSDVASALAEHERFERVLTNPPFHVGKGVRLDLPRAFIREAFAHLVPAGELLLVANRALPYEAAMAAFGPVETLSDDGRFKVLRGRLERA
jgi:16S rRNA (guanine1207-N2)-methyltransferase